MKKILLLYALFLTSCASMFEVAPTKNQAEAFEERQTRYSENPQMGVSTDRQYKKMTRSRMEEESDLQANAGSMWVMEGQTSYLFAQNKMRKEGDVLSVKLDPAAQKQVETKVQVIKKLLKQLEDEQKSQLQSLLAGNTENSEDGRSPASTTEGTTPGAKPATPDAKKESDDKNELADVQNIPSRIVEKLPDGNYRVKGAQPFMIGKREYKVLVTGLLRAEDFNDEGVSSAKLLDPQYDVVSLRRKDKNDKTGLF